ncbi:MULTISPECIES: chemotaxis protein CheW [unclassified Coleofasciculus]|uniref:chemotaxis protein CheW n=1 Tax=unclassified Coleofasciculus TaxID=2692782 RepID=UPI001880E669|nr:MULTISPECIES: chemotaxis protein CheW [unclassified Coleofasciculus]MBE9130241.1 chemotaxis protein CheW [Coleofasciculus sp. LEGE 07081]MBE9149149.1 chemotaxis protein CheW [Coleofasciculus sp. LEGE 07092]
MNSNLVNSQSDEFQQTKPEKAPSILKLIVFIIGNLNLALPIESVYKVLNRTPVYGSGIKQVGVSHIDNQEITVLDLYQRFFKSEQPSDSEQRGYLVTVQSKMGELYGIPVTDTPILMDVPLSAVRLLPESYRRSETVDIARHVAVIPQDSASLTVFLLDTELLLTKMTKDL